jgi:threonine/homoserine/homoserine lactone efflux protein
MGCAAVTYTGSLWLYTILVVGIIAVPGMDMLFVLAKALAGGRPAGLAATGGIMLGGLAHSLFGALGMAALLAWAPWLQNAMMLAGSLYLAWIGLTLMQSSITVSAADVPGRAILSRAFRQGLLTCLLNPKAYLFVVAVFPQFVRPEFGPLWRQALALAFITILAQLAIYGGLAIAAGAIRRLLVSRPTLSIAAGRTIGAIIVAVAALGVSQFINA